MTLALSMVAALASMVWYVFPKEGTRLARMAISYGRSNWRQILAVILVLGAFAVVPAQYAILLVLGLPLAYYAMYWWQTRHMVKCACGGNVTPLAGHGPCGCTLASQQGDSGLTDSLTCPDCGSKMLPTAGEGLSYRCSSDVCGRTATLR